VNSPKYRGAGWVLGDLTTGNGLAVAVKGVDAIIHAATDPRHAQAVDVEGTRRLLAAARRGHVRHFVQVSLAGIDDIRLPYYRARRAVEHIVMGGGLPYSIVRSTLFHQTVDSYLRRLAAMPLVMPLPSGFVVQSVDASEVAVWLVRSLDERPRGRLADFGGPDVMRVGEAAATWMRLNGIKRRILNVPVPGVVGASFRARLNTAPFGARGKVSWRDWLMRQDTMTVAHVYADAAAAHIEPAALALASAAQTPGNMRRAS
jgi:uncharacterized protein YbjT (DUF2867 family)